MPRLTFVELANDNRSLTVLATPADHQRALELLQEIENVAAQRGQPVVVTYPCPRRL